MKTEITEKENMRLCIEGKKPAWLPSFYDACSITRSVLRGWHVDPKSGYLVDIFGVEFTKTEDGPVPLSNLNQDYRLKDIMKWREIMPDIDLNAIDWESEAARIRGSVPGDKMIVYSGGPVWEQLHYMMGYEGRWFL
jgi:hypothetical protein